MIKKDVLYSVHYYVKDNECLNKKKVSKTNILRFIQCDIEINKKKTLIIKIIRVQCLIIVCSLNSNIFSVQTLKKPFRIVILNNAILTE